MVANSTDIEKRLWDAADNLRANSSLRGNEYSLPVLGLIFLRFADHRFAKAQQSLQAKPRSRPIAKVDYQALGVMFVPDEARYQYLLELPEDQQLPISKAVNLAMQCIEDENVDLKGALPKSYNGVEPATLRNLLKTFDAIPPTVEGDLFGQIYEYFLSKFAMSEGQKGGEFFTPTALVKLIVDIIEPFHGRIMDPACGSGGMFVQSAKFIERHQHDPNREISIYGQEKNKENTNLCKMNLAVHGLTGQIFVKNTFHEFESSYTGYFDFVMANPPFNVSGVNKDLIRKEKLRFPFGMPSTDNANYLWIQQFYSALKPAERMTDAAGNTRTTGGRGGFVMANSASDARGTEQDIRRQLIEAGGVDVMVSIGSNFFYTVTLPCTLWFLDRGKVGTPRAEQVLFIDARHIYRQVDRAHRDFTSVQGEFLANIARLYRGEEPEFVAGSTDLMRDHFPDGTYRDVAGLCKTATSAEIAAQGWSLNPGRYVGVAAREADSFVFRERLEALNEELELLTVQAHELEERISANVTALLEGGE